MKLVKPMRWLPVVLFLLVICVPVIAGMYIASDGGDFEAISGTIGLVQIILTAILTVLVWFRII